MKVVLNSHPKLGKKKKKEILYCICVYSTILSRCGVLFYAANF